MKIKVIDKDVLQKVEVKISKTKVPFFGQPGATVIIFERK